MNQLCVVAVLGSIALCPLLPWTLSASLVVGVVFACTRLRLPSVERRTVGFFHPNAHDGGGGERVLWCAVKALQSRLPEWETVLFAADGHGADELTAKARRNFDIQVTGPLRVVGLSRVRWLDPTAHPRFTLVGQALSSAAVAWTGLRDCVPEVVVDTSGWPFSYPLFRLAGARIVCYVHYPVVSSDMLERVRRGASGYDGETVGGSSLLSATKLVYYRLFSLAYGFAGMFPSAVMVNSTWTLSHVRSMWTTGRSAAVVYPPVDSEKLRRIPPSRPEDVLSLISVGQFRPEKNHRLQLEAFAAAKRKATERRSASADRVLSSRLLVVGSCRNQGDSERLLELRRLSAELGLADSVEFFENVPFSRLVDLLSISVAGLHTMIDEHFGIGIVEFMASGVIPIAHDSGGPKTDILAADLSDPGRTFGFLRRTADGYADAIETVLAMETAERTDMAERCRRRAETFSQERFAEGFLKIAEAVLRR